MKISIVENADDRVIEAIGYLLPQVSSNVPDNFADNVRGLVANPDSAIIIGENEEGRILGLTLVSYVQKMASSEARIDEVVVDEAARGHGLGTLLMNKAEDWAREKGARRLELTSRPSRWAANHLYNKLDYLLRETNVYNKKLTSEEE